MSQSVTPLVPNHDAVLTIAGSPASRSRSTALLRHAASRLREHGLGVQELGIRDVPASDLVEGAYGSPAAAALRTRVGAARALIIATPIYKASFAGGLKALLDLLDERSLADKVVLPLATGGSPAHLLALEYSLKPVLSALGARHILAGVYACDQQLTWRDDGSLTIDADVARRFDDGLAQLRATLTPPARRHPAAEGVAAAAR